MVSSKLVTQPISSEMGKKVKTLNTGALLRLTMLGYLSSRAYIDKALPRACVVAAFEVLHEMVAHELEDKAIQLE